jgi:hypothetical protein
MAVVESTEVPAADALSDPPCVLPSGVDDFGDGDVVLPLSVAVNPLIVQDLRCAV